MKTESLSYAGLRRRAQRATGSVYVAILGLSILVAVIGLGGVAISRSQARARDLRSDTAEARSCAVSAIEVGRALIAQDATWRTDYVNGTWRANQSIGNGYFSLVVRNPNGALNQADSDPVIMTGTGTKGTAVQMVQVTLNATLTPFTSLSTAVTAGAINFQGTTVYGAGSIVSSLSTLQADNGNINPNVEAVTSVSGGTYCNKSASGIPARTVPNSHVFDYYLAQGTQISLSSLPVEGGNYQINKVVLSPAVNPFGGTTNSQGIYIIDCQGGSLIIQNCRIVGTVVVLNPGTNSLIINAINWVPAIADYPCLLVKGDMPIQFDSNSLNELGAHNYNPSGTPYPYPGGTSNTTTSDSYPSAISGLLYVSGNVQTDHAPTFSILLVGGTLTTNNTINLTYDATYHNSPPPGFYTIQMLPAPGSWKQVTN